MERMRSGSPMRKRPALAQGLDDVVVAGPDEVAEVIAAQIVPDVLHRVQLWRVWGYQQQGDVVRHRQFPAGLVPSGTVAEHLFDPGV